MDVVSRSVMDISVEVDAPPPVVWQLVTDLRRMGEWSPTCTGARWPTEAGGAALGLRFGGTNRNGRHRWRTTCTIVAVVPEREITWCVTFLGFAVSQWGYRLAPLAGGGTRLTETWRDLRTSPILHFKPAIRLVNGARNVPSMVEANIRGTLTRLKADAERVAVG